MGRMTQAVVAVAALAVLAAPVAAQRGQGARPGQDMRRAWAAPGSMARNPVAVLLEHRDALELTTDQVGRLEAIRARVERENGPRIERLEAVLGDRAFRDLTDDERAQVRARMQELQPVRDEIRATNRAAMEEARDLLTAAQQDRLRDVMRRGPRDGMRGSRTGLRGGRPGGGAGMGPGAADRSRPFAAPVPGGMAARVLEEREALGLTDEQVGRLEAEAARVAEANEERMERLREDRDQRHELMAAIRTSHRESLEAVREILTDEQEARLRELAPRRGGRR